LVPSISIAVLRGIVLAASYALMAIVRHPQVFFIVSASVTGDSYPNVLQRLGCATV